MQIFSQLNISDIGMCLTMQRACLRLSICSSCEQVVYLEMGFQGQQWVSEQGRRDCQYKAVLPTGQGCRQLVIHPGPSVGGLIQCG